MAGLTPATPRNTPWLPIGVALAVVPTLVLGFETYSPGAYLLFGILFALHTPFWFAPRSARLWTALAIAGAAWVLFAAMALGAVPEAFAHAVVVGLWQAGILRVLLNRNPLFCLTFGLAAAVGMGLLPTSWTFGWAATAHLLALALDRTVVQNGTWRAPRSSVRTGFACLYGVFLMGFAAIYAPVMLHGAATAAAAVANAPITCGFLGSSCEAFAHLASRAAYADAASGALRLNHAGSVAAAGAAMTGFFSWVSARHRAAMGPGAAS